MIRDPSDGSVRETGDVKNAVESAVANRSANQSNDLMLTSTSGLPTASTKPKDLAKLEKSRDWLKQYFKRNPEQGT